MTMVWIQGSELLHEYQEDLTEFATEVGRSAKSLFGAEEESQEEEVHRLIGT